MRCVPLFVLAVYLTVLQFAQAVPVDAQPADYTIENRLLAPTLASPLWSAKHLAVTDQQPVGDVLKDEPLAETTAVSTPKRYSYADAYRAFEQCGKLCVLITTNNCPPCEKAKEWFQRVAMSGNSGACILMHEVEDAAEVADIKEDGAGFPQLIVYHAASGTDVDAGEPSRQVLVGYQAIVDRGESLAFSRSRDLQRVSTVATQASYAAPKCAGGCDSCPADCAANGCGCGATHHAHAAGACCGGGRCGLVPGQPIRNLGRVTAGTARWFQEHKPVRRAVAGVAIGSARVVGGVLRGTARLLCPGCRRCR